MGSFSIWHWLILLLIVLVVFGGRGKVSDILGDFGKGIKSFKKGMQDDEEEARPAPPRTIDSEVANRDATPSDRSKV